ncbi:MAG: glycosyltransferase [Oscillospiraceae bacterium]|nr:glycosyltransferase [Oscillospiraceae bacterium]
MIKVSIIVPVHNSEKYLHKCVDSLTAQTLEEIEIILVDDASADASRELMADYADRYPKKIRCLYLDENIRQGGARNRGMDIARGEYIAFVDSDDFAEPDMCRTLYEAAAGADMCGADYWIDRDGALEDVRLNYGEGKEMTPEKKAAFLSGCGYFWSRIYRRDLLEKYHLRFPENVYYEDAWFNFMTALYAQSCVKAAGQYYHYYQSPDSTVRKNGTHQYERIAIPSLIIGDCRARGIYIINKDLVDYKYINMQMSNIRYICLERFDKPDKSQLRRIADAIRAECPDFSKCKYYKNADWVLRVYLRLNLLSPTLAVWGRKLDSLIQLAAIMRKKLRGRKV